jgi:hypothetical protein
MRRLAVGIALAALALSACSTADGGGTGGTGGTGGGSGTGSGGSDPSGSAPERRAPVVSLQRFGGIGGTRDEVTVQPDGSWRRTARAGGATTGRLTADGRDQLSRMAAEPMLRAEAARTAPEPDCTDAFDYSLTVGSTRIAWRDCGPATKPPATATRIARFLLENTNSR